MDSFNSNGRPIACPYQRGQPFDVCRAPRSIKSTNGIASSHKSSQGTKRRLWHSSGGRRGLVPAKHYRATKKAGSVVLGLILFWLPILAIFPVILWVRVTTLHHLTQQRQIDRCLYPVIERRCQFLAKLSASNATLRRLVQMIATIEIAKQATSAIPIVGAGMAAAGESTAAALRTMVRSIAKLQDLSIKIESVQAYTSLTCGTPLRPINSLNFDRPQTLASTIAKSIPPLNWAEGSSSTEMHLMNSKLLLTEMKQLETFAHCFTERKDQDGRLDGEQYRVSFRHAPAKRHSKPLSFSQPY